MNVKKIQKKVALLFPPVKKLYQNIVSLRKQCEDLQKENEEIRKENNDLKSSNGDLKRIAFINNSYNIYKANYQADELPELALFRPQYPHIECAVIIDNRKENVKTEYFSSFCDRLNFHCFSLNNYIVLSMRELLTDVNGKTYLFSGITRWKDKLIFGDEDIIKNNIDIIELCEGIGEFNLLTFDNDKLEISSDFFGMCHHYYYKSDKDLFVTATSYHLLLLILKEMNVEMKLNEKKITATMPLLDWVSQTNFTEEMDVEKCYILPPDKKIIVYNKNIIFSNTNLFYEVTAPETFNVSLYEKYLYQAKDEIIANLHAVFQHQRFNNILCDLSGGIDSRMVIAAVLNLPPSMTEKIFIRSRKDLVEDFKIADSIVNTFNLKWYNDYLINKISLENIGIKNDVLSQAQQSYNLGTYYTSDFMPGYTSIADTIHLTGGCGELISRCFFNWLNYSKHDENELKKCIYDFSDNYASKDKNLTKNEMNYILFMHKSISNLPESSTVPVDNQTDILGGGGGNSIKIKLIYFISILETDIILKIDIERYALHGLHCNQRPLFI